MPINHYRRIRAASSSQYALVLGLIAVIALVATTAVGTGVKGVYCQVDQRLKNILALDSSTCAATAALELAPPAPPPPAAGVLTGGSAVVNQTSLPYGACTAVSFTNPGPGTVSGFTAPIVSGSYQIGSCPATTCSGTLAASASCQVFIQGTRSTTGPLTGTVSLTASSGGSASVSVSGTASLGGVVMAWGHNGQGQMGDGTTNTALSPITVPGTANAVQVSASTFNGCLVDVSGGVSCAGNLVGSSGGSSLAPITGLPTANHVDGGLQFACASGTDGSVWCWGTGTSGQLGRGSTTSSGAPVQVLTGASTPLTGATTVSAGRVHACTIDASGGLWCWGSNLTTGGAGSNYAVNLANNVSAVDAGSNNTCYIANDGTVWCWGRNNEGELGIGATTPTNSTTPVQVRISNTPTYLTGASDISAGGFYACAISGGGVYCWGLNNSGQLGLGDTTNRSLATAVPSISGFTKVGTTLGTNSTTYTHTTCAVSGSLLACWGSAYLGNGTANTSTSPVSISVSSARDISMGNIFAWMLP